MWREYIIYPLALALFIGVILAFNGVALLLAEYSPALGKQWAASTPGTFLGGFALVLGFLRDQRFREQQERLAQTTAERDQATAQIAQLKRQQAEAQQQILQAQHQTALAEQQTEHARQQIAQERQQNEQARQQIAQERQRANDLAAQLQRAQTENARIGELAVRLRRLEAATGIAPPAPDEDDDGDDNADDGDSADAVP